MDTVSEEMAALRGRYFSLSFVIVVCLLATPFGTTGDSICEHEEAIIEKDLGGEENWKCQGHEIEVNIDSEPAGHSSYSEETPAKYSCDLDLEYDEHPPTSGVYRPEAPMYGEYNYLPPHRWLHALKLGALAFLYHPCANPDQVASLKQLASSCLWQHVISPYPHLPEETPLAIVAWEYAYLMQWVNPPEAKFWITSHAMKTNSTVKVSSDPYDRGLIHKAVKLSTSQICPDHPEPVSPHDDENKEGSEHVSDNPHVEPTSPCASQSPDGDHNDSSFVCDENQPTVKVVLLQKHHKALTALLIFLALILAAALLLLFCKICCAWRKGRSRPAKYKSVSKFFPFSYGKDSSNTVIIPELGMPKSAAAERETLLNESDEDEL